MGGVGAGPPSVLIQFSMLIFRWRSNVSSDKLIAMPLEQNVASKVSARLSAQCALARGSDPSREIPVIVTLREWSGVAALKHHGMTIVHHFEPILAVSGTLTLDEVEVVAELEQVVEIDADTEFRIDGA